MPERPIKRIGTREAIPNNLSVKNQIYEQNTHTHTQKLELRTLYFNFDWLFQNRLSQSVTEKSLIISLNHHD